MFIFIAVTFSYYQAGMKHLLIFIFLFSILLAHAQTNFKVIDSITQQPLELATVRFLKNSYTVFTDDTGNFESVEENESSAEISYVGYQTKIVTLDNSNKSIALIPKNEELGGLVIEQKRRTYTLSKKIKTEVKSPDEYYGFQFSTEHCTYIPNTLHKQGIMNKITLYLDEFKEPRKGECCTMDYLASYKISFYAYDSATKQPGAEIYDKAIIAYPENKTYRFSVNLDSLKIPFPANGVCIGVEIINTRYKNPKTTFAYIGPFLGFYKYQLNNNPQSWVRYRNEGWKFKNVVHTNIKHKISNALMITADVKM